MKRFYIRVDLPWRPLFLLLGGTANRLLVTLENDGMHLKLGWWKEAIPYADIESVAADKWPFYFGYGMRPAPNRRLGLVGSPRGVVTVKLRQPRTIKVPFEMSAEAFSISFEEPNNFIDSLNARLGAG